MAVAKIIYLSVLFTYSFALVLDSPSRRFITEVLSVHHHGYWGSWGTAEYCEKGFFAIGYQMKIEEPQGNGDDTSLNAISILCGRSHGGHLEIGRSITSKPGPWGKWGSVVICHGRNGMPSYLTQFALQSEADQRGGDDTSANYVKFKCRDFEGGESSELVIYPGNGFWGTWSQWSEACPAHSAICGIQTKVENHISGDNTALNDVLFMCCLQH